MAPWTDDNTHDPGITMLQAFAYAIVGTGVLVVARRAWTTLVHRSPTDRRP